MRLFPNMRSKRLARLFAVLTAVVLMLTLFCGCSDEDDVYLGIESMPVNLDPQLSQGEEAETGHPAPVQRLVTVRDGKITASAAESWEVSEDGLRYTFTIRDGECWSDGEPLTAEDYVSRLTGCLTRRPTAHMLRSFFRYPALWKGWKAWKQRLA